MDKVAHFNNTLDRGLEFERVTATKILHRLFPDHIIKRYAKDPTEKFGPRAFMGKFKQIELVLPDFEIYDPQTGTRFFVDAKLKASPYSSATVTKPYAKFLTIDSHAHSNYAKTAGYYKGQPIFLLFGVEENRCVYMAPWKSEPEYVRYDNQYGTNNTPIYYVDVLTQVGTF